MIEQKRIVVFVDKEDYKQLKAKIIMMETTLTAWLRKVVKEFIQNDSYLS